MQEPITKITTCHPPVFPLLSPRHEHQEKTQYRQGQTIYRRRKESDYRSRQQGECRQGTRRPERRIQTVWRFPTHYPRLAERQRSPRPQSREESSQEGRQAGRQESGQAGCQESSQKGREEGRQEGSQKGQEITSGGNIKKPNKTASRMGGG